ncbi:MAG: carboxymuconolactone decarboxylase family protein [Pirellula sp.]
MVLASAWMAIAFAPWVHAQEKADKPILALVEASPENEPRRTPTTRDAMKQYLEDLKDRKPRIPLPELTEEQRKAELENPRASGYESRLRSNYLENAPNAYLTFGGSPAGGYPNAPANNRTPPDPIMSLDYAFKVRMFWIAARANNCQYCLGHQESKLLAAGMTEDQIAALDSAWELFPENEQVAFALAKRLTLEPHRLTEDDIAACKAFYADLQILEMLGSIAGNNAINRWKEGAGVPQSRDGGNFGRGATASHESYLTKTSDAFATKRSKIVNFDPGSVSLNGNAMTVCNRPPLLQGADLENKLRQARTRSRRLPIADEATSREVLGDLASESEIPEWKRLLAQFPIAGKRLVAGIVQSKQSDSIDAALQAKLDWLLARQDHAWYLTALAEKDLHTAGVTADQRAALDGELNAPSETLSDRDRSLLLLARNLAASPIVLTDAQVAKAIELAGPRAVTQVINYTCYRAALNRITEGAGLNAGQ